MAGMSTHASHIVVIILVNIYILLYVFPFEYFLSYPPLGYMGYPIKNPDP